MDKESGDMSDWKEMIQECTDPKELDYIISVASAHRQMLDAEKRKNKPVKGDGPFPTETENPDDY